MSKKIVFFLRKLSIGGIQRAFINLANEFTAQGYDIDLVFAVKSGKMEDDVADAVRIVDLASRRVLTSLPKFIRYTWRHKPDVIVSGHDSINQLLSLCNAAGLIDARLVVSAHTHMSHLAEVEGVWYSGAIPFLVDWTYPFADQIVAVSKGVADDLQAISRGLNGKVSIIYNPVVDDTLQNKSQEKINHPWIRNTSIPVMLGVGRMTPSKNFPLLIRAFCRIQESTGAKLMILGDGPERRKIQDTIRDRGLGDHVELTGYVSNPYAYLSKASLFVLSSNFEGLSIVLIEALACGCPVVSTNCPSGPSEILEDGKWGSLVPVGDADALADAMVSTLKVPPDPADLKKRAEAFSVDTAVEKYRKVFFE